MKQVKPHVSEQYVRSTISERTIGQAVEMLLAGESIRATADKLNEKYERVRTIYHTMVKPQLRQVDWAAKCRKSKVPELEAARLHAAIKLDARAGRYKEGWRGLAAECLGVDAGDVECASMVLRHGTQHTIRAAASGTLSLFEAAMIAVVPAGRQLDLVQAAHKEVRTAADYLRVIVFSALDQKKEFERIHPPVVAGVSLDTELNGHRREEMMFAVNELIVWLDEMARILAESGDHSYDET